MLSTNLRGQAGLLYSLHRPGSVGLVGHHVDQILMEQVFENAVFPEHPFLFLDIEDALHARKLVSGGYLEVLGAGDFVVPQVPLHSLDEGHVEVLSNFKPTLRYDT